MKFFKYLLQPVNNSPLIIFRIAFGFLLSYQFLAAIFSGTIYTNFIQPPFTFTYIGFEFLQPLPGNGMYFYVGLMILLALMIMTGAWYRFAIISFTLLWTALYLMQKAGYNNHYYLIVLLCWIMMFMPANRYCSVDVKRKAVVETNKCSRYCLLIFIVQIAIVYFFGAISKLSSDWLSGKFIAIQFSELSRRPIAGIIYGQRWFQLFICYAGFLFDLLIIPLLIWKKTRIYAFIAFCIFHLFNSFSFHIGTFPYLCIALGIFFFDPNKTGRLFFRQHLAVTTEYKPTKDLRRNKALMFCFLAYTFFQILIPMRSWFYPGNVFWNEEGYRMSWKMMLRAKTGSIYFKVIDPTSGKQWKIDPADSFTLEQVMWIAISPDITWQYSQRLKKDFVQKKYPDVEIYAISQVRLNRSKAMPLVDTTVNLAAIQWQPFRHSSWITNGP